MKRPLLKQAVSAHRLWCFAVVFVTVRASRPEADEDDLDEQPLDDAQPPISSGSFSPFSLFRQSGLPGAMKQELLLQLAGTQVLNQSAGSDRHASNRQKSRQGGRISVARAAAPPSHSSSSDVDLLPALGAEEGILDMDSVNSPRQRETVHIISRKEAELIKLLEKDVKQEEGDFKASPLGALTNYPTLMSLAGGIGATVGTTGSAMLDRDLISRMKVQDLTVMLLLLLVYYSTISLSAVLAHRQAANNSRVKFYADPRHHFAASETTDQLQFLEAFNQEPKHVYLQISGYQPVTPNYPGSFLWKNSNYVLVMSFALDLSEWVTRGDGTDGDEGEAEDRSDNPEVGVPAEELQRLQKFLTEDSNDLAVVQVDKVIHWDHWEDLAVNIKQRIRQTGFEGVVKVERKDLDTMCVYKNRQWANFLHSRALKVLLALSVVGWLFYMPYMMWRCSHTTIKCHHHVKVSIGEYWDLIANSLTAYGFRMPDVPHGATWPVNEEEASETSSEMAS